MAALCVVNGYWEDIDVSHEETFNEIVWVVQKKMIDVSFSISPALGSLDENDALLILLLATRPTQEVNTHQALYLA